MKATSLTTAPTYAGHAAVDTVRAVTALAALAQPTRLAIFRSLTAHAPGGLTPGELATIHDIAPPTISFHLKELATAGLVAVEREGRRIRYRADLIAMNALVGYLVDHCCRATGRLTDSACATGCAPAACSPTPAHKRQPR